MPRRRWNVAKNRLLTLVVAAEWAAVICLVGALLIFAFAYGGTFLAPRQPAAKTVAVTAALPIRLGPTVTQANTPGPVFTLPKAAHGDLCAVEEQRHALDVLISVG